MQTALAERSLSDYVRQAWPVLEPTTQYLHNYHIDLICEHLEAVTAGEIRRLIINIPPRYMKSILVSVDWPTWAWIGRSETRWMFGSYAQGLSIKHSVDRRTIIESDWYQRCWGDRFRMRDDQNTKAEFVNDKRGHMIATSVDGTATGKGADILVVDDPVNPKEAHSLAARENANTWFDRTFYTRLDDKKRGAIVVVMQRLHEQDLTGHLLAKETGWRHLCLPAEAPERTVITMPVSGRVIVRETGAILWPEREGPQELADAKKTLGSYGYAGQYQQRPAPEGGGIWKQHWWRYWQPKGMALPPVTVKLPNGDLALIEAEELPEQFDQQLQSWDMTFKGNKDNDYVAGGVWGAQGARRFLLDLVHDQMGFTESCRAVRVMTQKWPQAYTKLIEDKANGPAIMETLQSEIGGIIAVEPQGGKEARAHAAAPFIEAGNVYLPHPHLYPWVGEFLVEASLFPNAPHDDKVDQASQALLRMAQGGLQLYFVGG